MARDSYSYLHFPMVAGIALLAVGLKITLEGDTEPLKLVPTAALLGGAAIYLLAHVAFRLRNVHSLSGRRLVCSIVLLALAPITLALGISSLATLAVLAAVLTLLIVYEVTRYADVRDRVRHQGSPAPKPPG